LIRWLLGSPISRAACALASASSRVQAASSFNTTRAPAAALEKRRRARRLVGPAKRRDRLVIRMRVGGDEPRPDVPIGGPLDAPR